MFLFYKKIFAVGYNHAKCKIFVVKCEEESSIVKKAFLPFPVSYSQCLQNTVCPANVFAVT